MDVVVMLCYGKLYEYLYLYTRIFDDFMTFVDVD